MGRRWLPTGLRWGGGGGWYREGRWEADLGVFEYEHVCLVIFDEELQM